MRIVVIEDEDNTRRGILNLIRKLGAPYEIAGDADNGRDGLALIERTQPDLVIADIKMPYMSGIDMLEALRDKGHRHQTVILTGFSEYEYAKKALRLGVTEFLEKPITADDLRTTLDKVRQELALQRIAGVPGGHASERLERILCRAVTTQGADDAAASLPALAAQAAVFDPDRPFELVRVYLGRAFEARGAELKASLGERLARDIRCVLFAVPEESAIVALAQAADAPGGRGRAAVGAASGDRDAGRDDGADRGADRDAVVRIRETIRAHVRAADPRFAVSAATVPGFDALKARYDALKAIRRWFLSLDEDSVLDESFARAAAVEPLKYPHALENRLKRALSDRRPEDARGCFDDWLRHAFADCHDPQQTIDGSVRLASAALQMIGELYGDEWVFRFQKNWLEPILAAETRAELRGAFAAIADQLESVGRRPEAPAYGYIVQKTVKLIHERYADGVTLEEIAALLHITPEYLSALFAREVGSTFSAYVKDVRIGRAKALLLQTKPELKMFEIARLVGYPDPKYFSRVFKETTGMTPAEYQKIHAPS